METNTALAVNKNEKGEVISIVLAAKPISKATNFCRTFPGAFQIGNGIIRVENDKLVFEQTHSELKNCTHQLHRSEIGAIQNFLREPVEIEYAGYETPGFRIIQAGTASN